MEIELHEGVSFSVINDWFLRLVFALDGQLVCDYI